MTQNPPISGPGPLLQDVELSELQPHAPSASVVAPRLGLFAGVKAKIEVRAGHAQSTVGELLALKDGSIFKLDREVDAPFDVLLDGQLIARGQLVAVGDHFGVRVTEVCVAQS